MLFFSEDVPEEKKKKNPNFSACIPVAFFGVVFSFWFCGEFFGLFFY